MRKVVFRRFGGPEVLELVEAERPTPKRGEVRIRIVATTVTSAESAMRRGEPLWGRTIIGFTGPRRRFRTLGNELAGVIDAVGAGVTRFREGDEVFGFAGFRIGANADYLCLPATASLAPRPARLSFGDAAAAVDGSTTALFFLRDRAKLQPGQRVLVIGASGSIGTFAVQLARRLGAHVSGVCSDKNVELVRSLGAHRVIDYTQEDFTQLGERYDVVFDTVGKSSWAHSRRVLEPTGAFVPTVITVSNVLQRLWTPLFGGGPRVIGGMSVEKNDALRYVLELLDDDELRVVVDRRFPLEEVAAAHRIVDTGHKRGNIVIEVADA
ncbi:MAG: NAD(P)-dependent alcohol dehydrogenase [Sandaracinaceae bacterium]